MNPLRPFTDNLLRERERWLLWTPLGIGAGIVTYFQLPFEPPLWILAAAPLLALAAWLTRRWPGIFIAVIIVFICALGFNSAQLETLGNFQPMLDREIGPAPLQGRLMVTEVMPDGVRLTLKNPIISRIAPEKTPQQVRIRMKDVKLSDVPPPGALLSLFARVGPFSEPVMPNAYDFRRQSYFMDLGGTGWARGEVQLIDPSPHASFADRFNLSFERMRRALTLHVYERLHGDEAAMTAALLNGEQNSISKDVIQAMRVSGIAHILSISGLHVSMMGLLVYIPLRALLALFPWIALRFSIKKWAAATAILATALYTILVGPQAPTLRSALSTGVVMFAIIVDRRALSMRMVALAASLVMLIQPDGLMGPSFQMSFAAVLAMVAAFEKSIDRALLELQGFSLPVWLGYVTRHAFGVILASLVATAATTPFTIYHFQNFSFYGVIANILAIPLTSFWIMPCILLAYITAPFGWDGLFISGAGQGVHGLIWIANKIAVWPYAQLHMAAMPAGSLLAIVLGGLWLCLMKQSWRFLGVVPIIIGMLYPFYTAMPDFIVTDDGKQWAARLNDGRLAISNLDREKFTVEQWQKRLGFPDLVDIFELAPDEKQIRCDDAGCVYQKDKHVLALPTLEAAALEDCERADIIVAPFLIRDCGSKIIIDDPQLHHHGAHAIDFKSDGSTKVEYVREKRGMRPWNVGWKKE